MGRPNSLHGCVSVPKKKFPLNAERVMPPVTAAEPDVQSAQVLERLLAHLEGLVVAGAAPVLDLLRGRQGASCHHSRERRLALQYVGRELGTPRWRPPRRKPPRVHERKPAHCAERDVGSAVPGRDLRGLDWGYGSQREPRIGWEYVHVAIDDHTRLAYAEVLRDEKANSSIAFLQRARNW